MAKFTALILFILTVSCAAPVQLPGAFESERDCGLIRNTYSDQIRQLNLPIQYVVDYTVPGERLDQIRAAAKVWNDALGFEVIQVQGMANGMMFVKSSTQVIWYVMDETAWNKEFESSNVMVTVVGSKGQNILQSNIYVNDYFTHDYSAERFIEVMSHEFGHALGLPHSKDRDDIMYYSYVDMPTVYDRAVAKLQCMYGSYKNRPKDFIVSPPPSLRKESM